MSSQEKRDALFIASDSRSNFKNVIAKRSDLAKFARGRMVTPGSDTVYQAGLVLGMVTANGKFAPYDDTATDGTQTAVGILSEEALVGADGNGTEIVYLRGATVFKDMLIGLDANGIVDLGGKSYVEAGVNLMDF